MSMRFRGFAVAVAGLLLVCATAPCEAKTYKISRDASGAATVEEVKPKQSVIVQVIQMPGMVIRRVFYGTTDKFTDFKKPIRQKDMAKPLTPPQAVAAGGQQALDAVEQVPGVKTLTTPVRDYINGTSSKK